MKLVTTEEVFNNEELTKITCPVCSNGYTHVYRADMKDSNENYEAWKFGKGDAAVIKMYCENDHKFKIIIGEHKGSSYLSYLL